MHGFSLQQHQLTVGEVHRNLPASALYEHAIRYEKDASIAENGALVAYSGAKTGRSPRDKRVGALHAHHADPAHPEELADFGEPDVTIYNAGAFPANRLTTGMGSITSVILSLEDREMVILGTEYAGEMKKGVFTVANYFAPRRGILSMRRVSVGRSSSGTRTSTPSCWRPG